MSATNLFETELLSLIFENLVVDKVGDTAGLQPSATAGSFFISLHTASLADTDATQTVSEAAYTGYGREAVARSTAGWTVTGNNVDNDAAITFGTATTSETETDFGIGELTKLLVNFGSTVH